MGIKRPKKRPSLVGIKSDDKRARLEAGLDLQLNTDLSDATLGHIVKEVVAPKSKLELLESWLTSITSFMLNSPLPKAKTSSITTPPCALPKEEKYPGARLVSCKPVGTLASPTTLVFPNAAGSLQVEVAFVKPPSSSDQLLTFWHCALAQIKGRLAASDLVESGSVFYELGLFSCLPSLQLRPAGKLGRHLEVSITLSMPDIQPCEEGAVALELASSRSLAKSLTLELRNLISSQPAYKALLTALHIWARQTLVLHMHTTSLLAPHMKAWQGLRKLWSFLAASDFLNQDLILGVAVPVPSSAATSCCPILDKAGTSPLFPLMTRAQWRLLVTFASAAQSQGVEKALLVSFKPEAFYDRIFEVRCCGRTSASDIVKKLVRGLVDRVNTIGLVGGDKAFSGEEDESVKVSIGLRLDPATYWQPTTLGPEASDEKACGEFRTFWGERSQLRRFHDGTVREVVVWGGAREELVGDLVRAVISRHFGGCLVEERGGWGEGLVQGDGGLAARAVLDTLVPELYNLEGLPLAVAGVAGSGPAARGSRVGEVTVRKAGGKIVREEEGLCKLTGKGGMAAASLQPLDVVLTAEHSGKWPKDAEAVRRLRAAWLAEVGKALVKKVPGLKAKLAGEYLLVLKNSTVLRLSVGERGEEGSECEVTSWLSGISKTFPAWSGASRLCLRWSASHLLSTIPSLAIEVTCAAILAGAAHPPTSPTAAFLLFLSTVASHDWNSTPICAPGSSIGTLSRSKLPPMAVLTPHSITPSQWTASVTWPELQRLVTLATTSMTNLNPHPIAIFKPNLECYEALIHIRPLQVPSRHLALSIKKKSDEETAESESCDASAIPIVDHDPVAAYVQQLVSCYSHLANFYYDRFGGTVIAVKLRTVTEKVNVGALSGKMVKEGLVSTNWGAIMEDWNILGEGLVREIQVVNTDAMV